MNHSLLIYFRADTWNILQNSGALGRHHIAECMHSCLLHHSGHRGTSTTPSPRDQFGLKFILTIQRERAAAPAVDQSLTNGLAYIAALSCYKGVLNPAFVSNKFSLHWMFLAGSAAHSASSSCNVRAKDVEAMSVRSKWSSTAPASYSTATPPS